MTIHIKSIIKEHFQYKIGQIDKSEIAVIVESLNKIIKY